MCGLECTVYMLLAQVGRENRDPPFFSSSSSSKAPLPPPLNLHIMLLYLTVLDTCLGLKGLSWVGLGGGLILMYVKWRSKALFRNYYAWYAGHVGINMQILSNLSCMWYTCVIICS